MWAMQGLVAGCTFATTIVKVYTLEAFDIVIQRHHKIDFDFYIDDLTISGNGAEDAVAVRDAGHVGRVGRVPLG